MEGLEIFGNRFKWETGWLNQWNGCQTIVWVLEFLRKSLDGFFGGDCKNPGNDFGSEGEEKKKKTALVKCVQIDLRRWY